MKAVQAGAGAAQIETKFSNVHAGPAPMGRAENHPA